MKSALDLSILNFSKIDENKKMSNGMRDISHKPLTEDEINLLKKEIKRIEADESVFVFNSPKHQDTCYSPKDDKVYVGRNVFSNTDDGSIHPRDVMSPAAVLAHEYYGHRYYRKEYLETPDLTPEWQDECRASITASKKAKNLKDTERKDLVMDARYRAWEYGQVLEMDDYMKEAVYGKYTDNEKPIIPRITPLVYIPLHQLPEMRKQNPGKEKGQQRDF